MLFDRKLEICWAFVNIYEDHLIDRNRMRHGVIFAFSFY